MSLQGMNHILTVYLHRRETVRPAEKDSPDGTMTESCSSIAESHREGPPESHREGSPERQRPVKATNRRRTHHHPAIAKWCLDECDGEVETVNSSWRCDAECGVLGWLEHWLM